MSTFLSAQKSASPFLSTFLSAVIFFEFFFWVLFWVLGGDPNLYEWRWWRQWCMKAVWRWALPLLALVQHSTQLSCAALMFCTFLILVLETSITLCSVVSEWVYPQFFFYLSQPHSTSHFDTGTLWHWHTTMKGSAVRRCSYCDQCKSGRSIWLAWSRGHRDYMAKM